MFQAAALSLIRENAMPRQKQVVAGQIYIISDQYFSGADNSGAGTRVEFLFSHIRFIFGARHFINQSFISAATDIRQFDTLVF